MSQDTVTVGDGIEIPHHPFLEANKSSPCAFCGSDTILGLAIDKPEYLDSSQCSSKGKYNAGGCLPSPFSTLAGSGNLDRNIVSILLPKDDDDNIRIPPGNIMFGGIDEALYEGPMSTHPFYPPGTTQCTSKLHLQAYHTSMAPSSPLNPSMATPPAYTHTSHGLSYLPS